MQLGSPPHAPFPACFACAHSSPTVCLRPRKSVGPSLMLDIFFDQQWVYLFAPLVGVVASVVIIWVTAPMHDGGGLTALSKFPVQVPDWAAEDGRDSRIGGVHKE